MRKKKRNPTAKYDHNPELHEKRETELHWLADDIRKKQNGRNVHEAANLLCCIQYLLEKYEKSGCIDEDKFTKTKQKINAYLSESTRSNPMKSIIKENKYLIMIALAIAGFYTYKKFLVTPKLLQDSSLDQSLLIQEFPGAGGTTLSIPQLNA